MTECDPPTDDERLGMAWWNALTDVARGFWLDEANRLNIADDPTPADAWREYKRAKGAVNGT